MIQMANEMEGFLLKSFQNI
ncbi:hypothetical protein SOVF_109030, partial [Spinacia oleracea]